MSRSVTVSETIWMARPPDAVWDYTQNYANRSLWDASVLRADVLVSAPIPRVGVEMSGGTKCIFQYQLYERPRRTSLAMIEVQSPWFSGGGGSWAYEAKDVGTLWTQTNTLEMLARLTASLATPVLPPAAVHHRVGRR